MPIAFGGIIAFLFRGLNLAVALGTVLVTSNALSREDYGSFVLGLTVIGVVNAIAGGLTASAAYQVSNQRREPGAAFLNGLVSAAGVGALGLAAGAAVASGGEGEAARVAMPVALAAAAVILNGVISGVFLGRDQLVRYNVALVLPPLAALAAVATAIFGLDRRSPEAGLWAYSAGQWAAAVILMAGGGHGMLAGARLQSALVRRMAAFAALAGLSSGISYVNYRADLFVVRHFEGSEGVATYSLAVYLAESVWQVSGSLALATYPRVAALERRAAAELTARVMRHTVVLLAVICGALFLLADVAQELLFPRYEGMTSALRFILPGILVYGLAQSFSGFYTYQRGWPWASAVVAGTGLALDMVLAVLLVPPMGVNGAALASALAYSGAMAGALAIFLRSERLTPAQVFRFGRREIDDYRAFLSHLNSVIQRQPE
jgi:O-antigen/teichoic acid export membrane protein